MFWHSTRADVSPNDIPQWAIKLTAIGAVVVVTVLCVAAKKLGTRVAVVFTTVKVRTTENFVSHISNLKFLFRSPLLYVLGLHQGFSFHSYTL